MAKMASLHAQGVTELYDYNQGYEDGRAEERLRFLRLIEVAKDSHDHTSTLIFCKFCDEISHLKKFIEAR